MTAQNHTLPADDSRREEYSRLLAALQNMPIDRPLYVVVMTERPESFVIEANATAGLNRDSTKAVTVSDAVDYKRLVSVRRL